MTENAVIKHYKKQLIYRQHDLPQQNNERNEHVKDIDNNMIYDFTESEAKNDRSNTNNGKKIRKKRKNKNCRGQFRHEGIELIKLGTSTSHSLCKSKEPYNVRIEKEKSSSEHNKTDQIYQKAETINDTNKRSVIQTNYVDKTIILENPPPKSAPYAHALPQMVPERRNSREIIPPKSIPYRSPPHPPAIQPEYRVPIHPTPYMSHPPFPQPLPQDLPFRPYPRMHSPPRAPPPPYPLARSPPRPVPRPPVRLIPQLPLQPTNYRGINFPFPPPQSVTNGYPPPMNHPTNPISLRPPGYLERMKRKFPPEEGDLRKSRSPPVVAAIDLTVDHTEKQQKKQHKCHCECGKTYTSDPITQKVIVTVEDDKKSSQVPTYFRGKMVNGVLRLEDKNYSTSNGLKERSQSNVIQHNGINGNHEVKQVPKPPVKDKTPAEGKLPQLFLIKDLLAKGVRVENKSAHIRIEEPPKSKNEERTNDTLKPRDLGALRSPEPRPKSQDYSVSTIIATNSRRQSVEVDTISISSSSSESVRSPRPKSIEKQIPRGKLFYYKTNNSFIRYFDDSQKKLFMDNLMADGKGMEIKHGDEPREIIELPKDTHFSSKDNLTVEEYVYEMTLAEKHIPNDFFLFYKFVTGYQICHNNFPVSFLTFLKIYNTNGLKILFERYVNSLKQIS